MGGSPKFRAHGWALKPSHVVDGGKNGILCHLAVRQLGCRQDKGKDLVEAGDIRGVIVCPSEGFLKKSKCELPALGKREWGDALPHPPSALTNFSEQNSTT